MSATKRIARTGYVILYPGRESMGDVDAWYGCYADGGIKGGKLNAQECAGLVEAGALVVHHEIEATGATIYRLVTP